MPSFDVITSVDFHELTNALDQVRKEVTTRYDFKGSDTTVEYDEKTSKLKLTTSDQMKSASLLEVVKTKIAKRGISLKNITINEPFDSGSRRVQELDVKAALSTEDLKEITKIIKSMKVKVTAAQQSDQVRVTGKNRDDLQDVMAHLKTEFTKVSLEFTNFRD